MGVHHCPECGAILQDQKICEEDFHQMLFWEAEFPELGIVHHLMVLCYHLQHPSLYAPDGLNASQQLLVDFLEKGLTTQEVRKQNRAALDSGNRTFKIKATADSHGSYPYPIRWTMTTSDVTAGGAEQYIENVKAWARSVHEALKTSGNLALR